MSFARLAGPLSAALAGWAMVTSAYAGPWIEANDPWLRADIETLSDAGLIDVPVTTWPLMWGPVIESLRRHDAHPDAGGLAAIVQRVRAAHRAATRSATELSAGAASAPAVIRGFGAAARQKGYAGLRRVAYGERWAVVLDATWAAEPAEGKSLRWDGSYGAAVLGNWVIAAGWIDRWWGPGQDTSLLVSTAARPAPGLMVQRNYPDRPTHRWLRWTGPWSLAVFAAELDDTRTVPDAKFLGASLSFRPLDSLEIGIRRTAQWGGEGRPESLGSLLDAVFGRDNCSDDICRAEEPGNQLAGVDLRWRLPVRRPANLYLQAIGEDEAGGLPSRFFYQFGAVTTWRVFGRDWRLAGEFVDTSIGFGDAVNVTYNHGIYLTGYRYRGHALGSSYDSDSRVVSASAIGRLDETTELGMTVRRFEINRDGTDRPPPAVHTVNRSDVDGASLGVDVRRDSRFGRFLVSFEYVTDNYDQYERFNGNFRAAVRWQLRVR